MSVGGCADVIVVGNKGALVEAFEASDVLKMHDFGVSVMFEGGRMQ